MRVAEVPSGSCKSPHDSVSEVRQFFFFFFLIIYTFLAALSLCWCVWAFSGCDEWGLFFIVVLRVFIVVASVVALRPLSPQVSVAMVRGLTCCPACGVFLDQGSNLSPLYWQADS